MFYNFGYEVSIILKKAEKERYTLRHPYVGTEHLMLALLSFDEEVRTLAMEYGVTYDDFRQALIETVGMASKAVDINLYTPMLKEVIEIAGMEAKDNNKGVVLPIHLFKAILEEGEGIAYRIFLEMGVPTKEMYQKVKKTPVSKELSNKNLEVLKIGVRMNDVVKMREKVVGRDKEMEMLIETLLRRQKNNPLLIGKAGVGKTALVEELVRKIKSKNVPIELQNMEVISLEMGSLVAGTKYRGEFEERLHKIIKEVIKEDKKTVDITEAKVLVSGGRGVGRNGYDMLRACADELGGEVASSRANVDDPQCEWAKPEMQVGQTGKTVRPDLYLACGISGAIQHVAGMENSDLVISINKNDTAPIFQVSDLGIVGDVKVILPKLTEALKKYNAEKVVK